MKWYIPELIFVTNDEFINIALLVSDFVVDDVPFGFWARSLVSLFNRVTNDIAVTAVLWFGPAELNRVTNDFNNGWLSWLRWNINNCDIDDGGGDEILDLDLNLVFTRVGSFGVSDEDNRGVLGVSDGGNFWEIHLNVWEWFWLWNWFWFFAFSNWFWFWNWCWWSWNEFAPGDDWLWRTLNQKCYHF